MHIHIYNLGGVFTDPTLGCKLGTPAGKIEQF